MLWSHLNGGIMELREILDEAFSSDIYKCIISNPRKGSGEYRKVVVSQIKGKYFFEKYTKTQVFHDELEYEEARAAIAEMLTSDFKNFNSWDDTHEYSVLISKKGKISIVKKNTSKDAPKVKESHNREKNYILKQGTKITPLIDMGIFTEDGKIVNSMYDKFKQINRFIEIVDDEVKKFDRDEITVLDFGCGKSYLTFVLYYYFTEIRNLKVKMIGLDLKEDVIEKCNITAEKYGYDGLTFEVGDISNYKYENAIDIVISLHACDTATDYALYNAINWNAEMIFSVPCCQHELNSQIESEELSLLTRYGIVKERFASLVTDSIRANLLEYSGYRTQMIEFVGFEHTPKNIMLRCVKKSVSNREEKLEEVEKIMKEFNLSPTLYRLLIEGK